MMTTPSPTVIEEARKRKREVLRLLNMKRVANAEQADAITEMFIAAIELGERRADAAAVWWLRSPFVPDHSDEGGCPFDKAAKMLERGDHRNKPCRLTKLG